MRPDRPAPGLEPPVLAWLGRALSGRRVVAAARLGGGYRNDNVLIVTGGGRYVLRRYGRADAAEAARTCAVEAALAARLARAGVPAAEVIAADPAGTAAGEPLLLARHMPGVSVSEAARDAAAAAGTGRAAGQALAAIGMIGFERGGMFTGPDLVPSPAGLPGSLREFVAACLEAESAARALSRAERDGLRALAAEADPLAAAVAGARQLVHSDYNAKNLLAVCRGGRWSISAVLDWEFAFSGSPLTDVGNMLRFAGRYPPGFAGGFTGGYAAAGGRLPPRWREISEALDLYALADFLRRPPGHPYVAKAVSLIRERLARDRRG